MALFEAELHDPEPCGRPLPRRSYTWHHNLNSVFQLIRSHSLKLGGEALAYSSSIFSMATKASCGMFRLPMDFMRFLPSFCFSNNLRLRVMSPP